MTSQPQSAGRPAASPGGTLSPFSWLVAKVVVPVLYGRRDRTPEAFARRIARDHVRGHASPPRGVAKRFRVVEAPVAGLRSFLLGPRTGAMPPTRLLYLHGGAYVFNMVTPQWPFMADLAEETGSALVVPDYPLAPEHTVAGSLAAMVAVYGQLVAEVGADRIVIAGDSAGGGFALALAQYLRDDGLPLPAGLALLFPWLDLTMSGEDQPALQKRDAMLSLARLHEAARMWAGGADPAAPPVSPLFGDHSGLPPTLVLVGTDDVLLSDTRRLAARFPEAVVREYPGMFHGFTFAPIREAREALGEASAFIGRVLPRS
jgi:acetyl esterase/lipase